MEITVSEAEAQMLEVLADAKNLRVMVEACEYLKARTVEPDRSRLADIVAAAGFMNSTKRIEG